MMHFFLLVLNIVANLLDYKDSIDQNFWGYYLLSGIWLVFSQKAVLLLDFFLPWSWINFEHQLSFCYSLIWICLIFLFATIISFPLFLDLIFLLKKLASEKCLGDVLSRNCLTLLSQGNCYFFESKSTYYFSFGYHFFPQLNVMIFHLVYFCYFLIIIIVVVYSLISE